MDVVCLGELLVDMFPTEMGRPLAEVPAFRPTPGGAPANVAVALARLGLASAFVGKVGDDAFGHHLSQVLAGEGVDVRGLRYARDARTTVAFIAQPDPNRYDILFYRNPGADQLLSASDLDGRLLREACAFHFGSISLAGNPSRTATLEALAVAREAGALISCDVNYRPGLWAGPEEARTRVRSVLGQVNLLKVNDDELALLTGYSDPQRGSRALLARGPDLVVVTQGPRGSFYACQDGSGHVPGFEVRTVDATGCGDAFVAGLLKDLLGSDSEALTWRDNLVPSRLGEILRYANAVGALTALQSGVIPALPIASDVSEFLAHQAHAHGRGTA